MAIGKRGDVELLIVALELFDASCIGSGIEAFVILTKTLRGWQAEIANYTASGGRRTASPRASPTSVRP